MGCVIPADYHLRLKYVFWLDMSSHWKFVPQLQKWSGGSWIELIVLVNGWFCLVCHCYSQCPDCIKWQSNDHTERYSWNRHEIRAGAYSFCNSPPFKHITLRFKFCTESLCVLDIFVCFVTTLLSESLLNWQLWITFRCLFTFLSVASHPQLAVVW